MTTTTQRLFVIRVTAYHPAVDHAVTDEETAARNAERRGEHRAVCGAVLLPASLDQPPGQRCPACRLIVRARPCRHLAETLARLSHGTDGDCCGGRTSAAGPGCPPRPATPTENCLPCFHGCTFMICGTRTRPG